MIQRQHSTRHNVRSCKRPTGSEGCLHFCQATSSKTCQAPGGRDWKPVPPPTRAGQSCAESCPAKAGHGVQLAAVVLGRAAAGSPNWPRGHRLGYARGLRWACLRLLHLIRPWHHPTVPCNGRHSGTALARRLFIGRVGCIPPPTRMRLQALAPASKVTAPDQHRDGRGAAKTHHHAQHQTSTRHRPPHMPCAELLLQQRRHEAGPRGCI